MSASRTIRRAEGIIALLRGSPSIHNVEYLTRVAEKTKSELEALLDDLKALRNPPAISGEGEVKTHSGP